MRGAKEKFRRQDENKRRILVARDEEVSLYCSPESLALGSEAAVGRRGRKEARRPGKRTGSLKAAARGRIGEFS